MSKSGKGNDTNPWKDFDVLRCIKCNSIIKVPKIAMEFACPHCGALNTYTMEEVDVEEVQAND